MEMLIWIPWLGRTYGWGDLWTQMARECNPRQYLGDFTVEQTNELSSEGLWMVWSRESKMLSESSVGRGKRGWKRAKWGARAGMPWLRWDFFLSRKRCDRIEVIVGWGFLSRKVAWPFLFIKDHLGCCTSVKSGRRKTSWAIGGVLVEDKGFGLCSNSAGGTSRFWEYFKGWFEN